MNKVLYWAPRILAILTTIFIGLMSVDVFTEGFSWLALGGFFIHNIPTFILIAIIVVSWKRELVGGIAFILLGIAYPIILVARSGVGIGILIAWTMMLSGPLLITGILFIINYMKKPKMKKIEKKKGR